MTLRRLIPTGLALLTVPALAFAGAVATDRGDTLRIKARFDPAQASKKGAARPMKVRYDYVAGTTDGSRLPDLRSVSVFLGGARFGFDAFPKCDERKAAAQGKGACPAGSRVGKGTAIAEIHIPGDTGKSEQKLDIFAFNGRMTLDRNARRMKPRDGLLLYTSFEGTTLAIPFWGEDRNRRITYYNPKKDPDPPADNALYAVKEVHLTFPRRSRRHRGRRVPFIAAPRRCDRRWTVTTTNDRYKGGKLTAKHRIRCRKA